MSFTISAYAELRPYLYHVTARENLPRLRRTQRFDPAAESIRAAGRPDLLRTRRPEPVTIVVDGEPGVLKDQRPLGDAIGPVLSGRRLLAHYEADPPAILRVPVMDLIASNPQLPPLFSPYNTGAPRMQRGKPVSRAPDVFRPAHEARRRCVEVVEVAFRGTVKLPDSVQVAAPPEHWLSIDAAAT